VAHPKHSKPLAPDVLTVRKAHAAFLLSRGVSIRKAAEQSGLSKCTVEQVKAGRYSIPDEIVQALQAEEAKKLTIAKHRILDSLCDAEQLAEALAKASLVQRTVAYGVMFDKDRLLRGEPTSIEEVRLRGMTDEEIQSELRRLSSEFNTIDAEFEEVAEPAGGERPADGHTGS
jgi:hypothetical protein